MRWWKFQRVEPALHPPHSDFIQERGGLDDFFKMCIGHGELGGERGGGLERGQEGGVGGYLSS